MNLQELKTKHNLNEGHLTLLFDVLYTYHKFDMEYSFDDLEIILGTKAIIEKTGNSFLKAMLELIEMGLIEFINDREVEFFIVFEELRGIEFFKELEREVC